MKTNIQKHQEEYRSYTPANHHPFAPIKGEYKIFSVQTSTIGNRIAHLASANWRSDDKKIMLDEVHFQFYLECLFDTCSKFPLNANINEMCGKAIRVTSIDSMDVTINNKIKRIYYADWHFQTTDNRNEGLTEEDLDVLISSGSLKDESLIQWEEDFDDTQVNEIED